MKIKEHQWNQCSILWSVSSSRAPSLDAMLNYSLYLFMNLFITIIPCSHSSLSTDNKRADVIHYKEMGQLESGNLRIIDHLFAISKRLFPHKSKVFYMACDG